MASRHLAAIVQSSALRGDGPQNSNFSAAVADALVNHSDAASAPAATGVPLGSGAGLRKYLIQQYKYGKMPAVTVCTIAHFATQAGALGVADLALEPSSQHHAEKLRRALEARSKDTFYIAPVPFMDHETSARKMFPFPICLPHEEFARVCREPRRV